jgi:hypothetical protein
VSRSVAANGDDQAIARARGAVGGITATAGLKDFQIKVRRRALGGASLPEAAGSAAARRRVDDDQRDQIRRPPVSARIWPVSSPPPKRFFRYGRKTFRAMPSRCSTST